ncbi:MAG: hypothetical protein WBM40_17200 [Thiohalocapsa sp.]
MTKHGRSQSKGVLAWQLQQAMESQHLSKVEMAKRMQTSRSQMDRLLDPDNDKVQLDTMNRAAAVVGKRLKIELIDQIPRKSLRAGTRVCPDRL